MGRDGHRKQDPQWKVSAPGQLLCDLHVPGRMFAPHELDADFLPWLAGHFLLCRMPTLHDPQSNHLEFFTVVESKQMYS